MVPSQLDASLLKKAAGEGLRHADFQLENVLVLRLTEHLALPVQHRQGLTIIRSDPHRKMTKSAANAGLE